MKKLLIGLSVVTALAGTTGFAAAQNNGNGSNMGDLSGYTKDQCKDGGWEALGFRNQGQCVAFFARQQGGGIHNTNNNDVDVNATTDQTSVSGSVEVSGNVMAGDAASGNASNTSSTSVGVSVSN